MARNWFEQGHSSVSIGMLWETMRWLTGIETTGDIYRLNNNYRSRYVRLLIERNPSWETAFRVRELRAA
ncbi:hypothetical protein [Kribbella italica]|uniref:Uncharacterized protein n=1 Tax=Kribbella italica TaxID=1540520 RepID=A0A7W9MRW7_9ACTN|nr:hypothetical protein [Kribbella italica]MBB5833445.1 hypothetical protein [Kribbella italica]